MSNGNGFNPGPYVTGFGRYDNARVPLPGGLNVPGAAPPAALGANANPPNQSVELVSWNANQPARGRGIRIWANPDANYNTLTCAQVGNANSISIEVLATATGFGGAHTSRRFVVNGGQEAVLDLGSYECGKIEIVASSMAFNVVAPTTDVQNQGWANFTWITGDSALTASIETKLMTRIYEATVLPANPLAPTRVVVPPGATGFKPFGQVHVGPVDFDWVTGAAPPATVARAGGGVPLNTFPVTLPGVVIPIRGAKFLDLEAPVGWPFNLLQFQFELAAL
jgi:hypothetical protein